MYRHLFWDLGGTLVDTYPALDRTFADVVRAHGHAIDEREVARLTRQSTGDAISQLSARFGMEPAEFERANEELKNSWETEPAPAMPGARQLMDDVHAAGGLNLVVTHRDRESAFTLLEGLGLEVDDLISTADGHPRKPDPEMYRILLERHGLDPDDCVAVGDRPIDAVAAHHAGIKAVMLESPDAPVEDEAEHSVETLDGLRPLLGLAPPTPVENPHSTP
ncbi:HAD-IA family hydrolase [Aestuariimicrobium sp. p3-SID1156]|uniref:HAD-IA family hydrolase n=1 Tax=Aestuariimicrobium sp. p3-SID1156 TaxID=2916038 RepID=UPI00223B7422|nr:HAD-IA family hydrolase [Aestuariimicrobium sp. p3-SID1156]MCT1458117.1 HAD-IA family hydrolase [Aestuariimicrobium sp. p3-SID1156]